MAREELEGEGFDFGKGQTCYGEDGNSDIDEGAQVTIRDGDGTKVALGALGQGIARGLRGIDCVFPFTVADVPTGYRKSVRLRRGTGRLASALHQRARRAIAFPGWAGI